MDIQIFILILMVPLLAADQSLTDMFSYQLETCNYLSLCPSPANSTTQQDHGQHKSCCTACSCSADCRSDGSCCPASQPSNQSSQGTHDSIAEHTECQGSLLQPSKMIWASQFRWYFMVSSCPESFPDLDVSSGCHEMNRSNVEDITPVSSSRTSRIYANKYCSLCHGEQDEDLRSWTLSLVCRSHTYLESERHMDMPFNNPKSLTVKQLIDIVIGRLLSGNIHYCNIAYKPPLGLDLSYLQCFTPEHFYIGGEKRICNVNMHRISFSPFLERCSSYQVDHDNATVDKTHESIHRTVFCSLCNGRLDNINDGCVPWEIWATDLPFSMLLNYKEETDNPVSNDKCESTEMLDPLKNVCRPVICPYFSSSPLCQVLVGKLHPGKIRFNLCLTPLLSRTLEETNEIMLNVLKEVERDLLQNDTNAFLKEVVDLDSWLKTTIRGNVSTVEFIYIAVGAVSVGHLCMEEMYDLLDNLTSRMSPLELNGVQFYITVDNRNYETKTTYFRTTEVLFHQHPLVHGANLLDKHDGISSFGLPINKFYFCPQVEIDANDFELIGNDFIIKLAKNMTVTVKDYQIVTDDLGNDYVRLCINDLIGMHAVVSAYLAYTTLPKYHMYTGILALCSVVALCLLICLEVKRASYISHRGRRTLVLAVYNVIAEISFGLARHPFGGSNMHLCSVFGLLNHYCGLNFIFWLGVCVHYTYRESVVKFTDSTERLKYMPLPITIFSMCSVAGIFVSVGVFVSLWRSDATQIGYESSSCLLSYLPLVISTLILPIGVCLVFSTIRITMALNGLRKKDGVTDKPVDDHVIVLLFMTLICLAIFVFGIVYLFLRNSWIGIGLEVLISGYGISSLCLWLLVPACRS